MFLRAVFLLVLGVHATVGQKSELAFSLKEKDLIPEGIAYSPSNQIFYISSINKRKIVQVDAKGSVSDFIQSGQEGVGQVLGMKVDGRAKSIWVCSNLDEAGKSRSMVHQFDLQSSKLVQKWTYSVDGEKHLFNDLVLTPEGAFISDSDYGAIFYVNSKNEKPEPWLTDEQLRGINGITVISHGSIVVNASVGFFKINPATKEIKQLPFPGYYPMGIDGLCTYSQTLVGIQNIIFPVSINQYFLDASSSKIEKARVLIANHPQFDIPTTGVMVEDWFYFIANSQLLNFDDGKVKDPAQLTDVLIMRVQLK